MKSFRISVGLRRSASVEALFPNFDGVIKVDDSVKKFLGLEDNPYFEIRSDFNVVFETYPNGGRFFDLVAPWPIMPTRDKVCAVLSYLGTAEGFEFLNVLDGQDETSVLLGYFTYGTKNIVFQVEHECEDGHEEIHLHGSESTRTEDGRVVAFHIH